MAQNPFDQFDAPAARPAPVPAGAAVPPVAPPAAPATVTGNPFDQFDMVATPGLPRDQMPAARMTTGQQVLEFLRPTALAVGTTAGGMIGTPLGPAGTVGGAGLGYAMTEEGLRLLEEQLGYRAPPAGPLPYPEPVQTYGRDILEGALGEAGGRAILGPVLQAGGRGLSKLGGFISDLRQIPEQRAARFAREAIVGRAEPGPAGQIRARDDITAARQALQARPELMPGQALAAAGQVRPTAQAALGRLSELAPERQMNMLNAQDAARLNQLAVIAGGADQTAARAARDEARGILNKLMIPQLEIELGAANIAGQKLPGLQQQRQQFGRIATELGEDAARARGAAERGVTMPPPEVLDDMAAKAELGQFEFNRAAEFADYAIDSLKAHKLNPLTSQQIISKIDERLRDVTTAPGNKPLQDIMNNVKQSIRDWTDNNGVINAWALENIRKHALSSYILSVPAGAEAAEKVAKQAAGRVKDIVADAIEAAGGTGYRAYLNAYSEGAQKISQSELGAQALRLYESAPRTFIKLVEGNDPKLLERIFGPGNYDVAKEMSEAAMSQLKGIAGELKRDREMAAQAKAGQVRFVELLKDYHLDLGLPNVLNVWATAANKILAGLSKRIGGSTQDKLIEAAKTAKSFDELLGVLPARERSRVLQILDNPAQWGVEGLGLTVGRAVPVAGGATAGLMSEPTNMLAPEQPQNMLMAP